MGGYGEKGRPVQASPCGSALSTAKQGGGPRRAPLARRSSTLGRPTAKLSLLLFLNLALALSQSLSHFFFSSRKEGRGGEKMLHCAPRPVSERRGANQRSPFRKLPFMARAATAPPYKTRQRDAQPLPRLRPPASTGLLPSPLFRLRRSTPPPGKTSGRPGVRIGAGPSPSPGRRRPSLLPGGKRLGAKSEAYALVSGSAALRTRRVPSVLLTTQGGCGP